MNTACSEPLIIKERKTINRSLTDGNGSMCLFANGQLHLSEDSGQQACVSNAKYDFHLVLRILWY